MRAFEGGLRQFLEATWSKQANTKAFSASGDENESREVSVETEVAARSGSTRIPVDSIQVGTEAASEVNLSAAAMGHDRCPLIVEYPHWLMIVGVIRLMLGLSDVRIASAKR